MTTSPEAETSNTRTLRERLGTAQRMGRELIQAINYLCSHPGQPQCTFELDGETITVTLEDAHIGFDLCATVAGTDADDSESCMHPPRSVELLLNATYALRGKPERVDGRNAFRFYIDTY